MNRPYRPCLPSTIVAAMFAVACAVASPPVAAQTFRIVGPDGRVTFSDRRPVDPALTVSEVGHGATPPGTRADPRTGGGGRFADKQPTTLGDAVLDVVAREDLIQAMADFCGQTPSATSAHLEGAAAAWRRRNAIMIQRTDHVLFAAFSPEQRASIHSASRLRLQPVFAPLGSTMQIRKIEWCDKSADQLASGAMDIADEIRLTGPIMGYITP